MSRVVVPIHLGNLAAIPTGTDIGFKQLYLRTDWVKLYNGVSEQDLVLDRPLDNFTPMTGSITAADSVLTALEKLQYSVALLANSISEAPNDGAQYVRKNEAWDKLTSYSAFDPNSTNDVAAGYPLGSDWYNTVTGEKFYQKGNGVWISYTSGTSPVDGSDSPVMFADYATNERLYTIYNEDPSGDQLISTGNEILFVDGVAMQVGDTVLVKDQPTYDPIEEANFAHQNGVYIVTDIGSVSTSYVLTRVDYADETSELYPSQVNILKGTNENRYFLQKTVDPIIGTSDIIYEINYVPATQTVVLPVIHVDTATTAPLPSCTYEDVFAPPVGGLFLTAPTTSYLTATSNGPLGVINGVNMSVAFIANRNRKILIKNQVDPIQNGDYEVIQIGSSVQPWKLRRITTTYSSFDKNVREWKINNEASTLYGNRYYMNHSPGFLGVIGNDPITFSELQAAIPSSLQDVTDVGNTTDNDIQFGTGVGVFMDNGSRLKEGTIDAGYGGSKGIAQICAAGYELKWEAGRLYVMGDGGTTIREVSHNFTTVPTNYNDISEGFVVGSRWLLDDGTLYICTDNSNYGAVWELQTAGNQSLQDVINVNKVADRVEFAFMSFNGSAFTGGYDYLIDFMESNQDNGIYIYGDFAQYGTSTGQDIVKVNSDGTIDTSFNVGTGFNNYPYTGSGKLAQTATGKLYVTGSFTTYNGVTVNRIVRLNTDGSIDASFVTGSGFYGGLNYTNSVGLDSLERVYVAGGCLNYNGTSIPTFIRLLSNGTIDTSFVMGSGFNNTTTSILVNSDDTLFVGGHFGTYNGVSSPRIIKLLSNGNIDTSFVVDAGFNGIVTDIVKTIDNKIIVVGSFTTYKGVSANKIIKLNLDGSRDTSFDMGTGFSGSAYLTKILLDGKVSVIADPGTYNGTSITSLVILNTDGSIFLNPTHSYTGFSPLSDGRFLGMSNTGSTNNYLVQVVNGLPYKGQKLTFSEVTGKAEYNIDTLTGTTTYELLPKHLIQYLISDSISGILPPSLQEVTNVGNTTSVEIISNTGFTVLSSDIPDEFAYLARLGIIGVFQSGVWKYGGTFELRTPSTDGSGFTATLLPTSSFSADRVFYFPNKNGTLAVTTDILPVDAIPVNGSSNPVSSNGVFDALASKILIANVFDTNHTTSTGNPYLIGNVVYYLGHIFRCVANNDAITPVIGGNLYWTDLGEGYPIRQNIIDWNATTGDTQIINKPSIDSIPTDGSTNAVSSNGVFDALALKADLVAGKVPSSQLPSYVDDVVEGYYDTGVFYSDAGLTTPITGETGKIYVDLLGNKSYRWSGSVYIQISNPISSINELTDVTVSSPLNGQLLQYNLTTNQWENQTIVVGTGDMQTSTYDIDNDGIVDFAETVPVVVRNPSVSDILRKGTIVYLSGSTGYRPNAYKAQANSEATSSGTFGVVLSDIGTTSDGTVAMMGTVHTLDTRNAANGAPYPFTNDVLVDGDVLWLDPNNAGYVTKTKPQAPNHIVFIGVVARTHPSLGRIVYRITNGYELDELHNVFINGTLADKHTLYYDAATSLWKTNTIAGTLGYTPEDSSNKSTSVVTDQASNTKYPTVKAVYDWAVGAFTTTAAVATQITTALSGYATQSWVTSQGYITNVISALGFTPVTNARTISTTGPLSGGGDLTADRTLSIAQSNTTTDGYLSSTDWNTFNNKQDLLVSGTNIKTINGASVLGSGNLLLGVPMTRQEFTYSGSQNFTLSGTPSYIYGVFVQGQELDSDQYSSSGTTLTILNTLGASDSVNILYTPTTAGVLEYYTKAEVDALLPTAYTPDINMINATKITLMYNT